MRDYGQELMLLAAKRMQALRVQRGLSLESLANAAGLHRTSVGLIERGERGMTIASAANLCRALGVTLAQVVSEAEREIDRDVRR